MSQAKCGRNIMFSHNSSSRAAGVAPSEPAQVARRARPRPHMRSRACGGRAGVICHTT